jgi:hypothetical protein
MESKPDIKNAKRTATVTLALGATEKKRTPDKQMIVLGVNSKPSRI